VQDDGAPGSINGQHLSFEHFNIDRFARYSVVHTQYSFIDEHGLRSIIDDGAALVASAGHEYDGSDLKHMSAQERLSWQHKNIRKKLGISKQEDSAGDLQGLIADSDLAAPAQPVKVQAKKRAATDIMSEIENDAGMTAREKNRAKRLAKQQAKRQREMGADDASSTASIAKYQKLDESDGSRTPTIAHEPWAFCSFCLQLREDLLSPGMACDLFPRICH
jgi:hypothetical protein